MKRVTICYDGATYTTDDENVVTVQDRIAQILESGQAGWLTVNRGEGRAQPAQLLVGPSIPIVLVEDHADDTADD